MSLMRWLCEKVSKHLKLREIWDREGGSLYLSRFYLFGPRSGEWIDGDHVVMHPKWELPAKFPVNVFLHKFHRSDDDGALHNHPWKWSVSLILAGGYSEERRHVTEKMCDMHEKPHIVWRVKRREVLPFSLNVIRADDFHRVDLLEKDCWSLFLAGPKSQSWGFWDRISGAYTPWRSFIAQKRGVAPTEVASHYEPGEKVKRR